MSTGFASMTPRTKSPKLFNLFTRYQNNPFWLVKPGGNFGDFLIYDGAEKLAKQANVTFEKLTAQEFMAKDIPNGVVIYIHGGGGMNNIYKKGLHPIEVLKKAVAKNNGVTILGPQSFIDNAVFLKKTLFDELGNHKNQAAHIFCREHYSLKILQEIIPSNVSLECDHDTAFNLTAEDFSHIKPTARYVLYCIRKDPEATQESFGNLFHLCIDPAIDCSSFEEWLLVHSQAKKIITNRLHSAIIGYIFGKDVTLLPNSYFKNRAIWEYSLRDKGIVWSDRIPSTPVEKMLWQSPIYRKLASSHKVNVIKKALYGIK